MITFTVIGIPQTAGSKRAFPFKRVDGSLGVRVSDDNPRGHAWKETVARTALVARNGHRGLLTGALAVTMTFYRPRPAGHFGKNGLNKAGLSQSTPTSRPDVLKLARAVEDALSGVIYRDDAQIVEEHLFKRWGEPARMEIEIREIDAVEQPALVDETLVAPWEKAS